jgi:hypothetical protein
VKAVILVTLIALPIFSNAQKLKNIRQATDSTYGYTLKNPVLISMGSTQKSEVAVYNYLNGIRRINGESFVVKSRTSVPNPKYKKQELEALLKKMRSGEQAGIMIDVYKLESVVKGDTMTLYIDMYTDGDTKVPVGMVWKE